MKWLDKVPKTLAEELANKRYAPYLRWTGKIPEKVVKAFLEEVKEIEQRKLQLN